MTYEKPAPHICHRCGLALRCGDYSPGFEAEWCTDVDGFRCQLRQMKQREAKR